MSNLSAAPADVAPFDAAQAIVALATLGVGLLVLAAAIVVHVGRK